LGEVLMGGSEVSTSVVKWSVGLCNRVPNIIRKYIDHTDFAAYMAFPLSFSFITFWLYFLSMFTAYIAVCFVCFCLIL